MSEDSIARRPLALFDVKGTVTVITGASGAFGRVCAISLAALGGKLVLASGSQAELQQLESEVRETGAEVAVIARRPDSLADAQAILQCALDTFGRVDQLVVASGTNRPGFIE
jgi:NADP-dependent 3-hydroxy acid dehydrogenase YdfG